MVWYDKMLKLCKPMARRTVQVKSICGLTKPVPTPQASGRGGDPTCRLCDVSLWNNKHNSNKDIRDEDLKRQRDSCGTSASVPPAVHARQAAQGNDQDLPRRELIAPSTPTSAPFTALPLSALASDSAKLRHHHHQSARTPPKHRNDNNIIILHTTPKRPRRWHESTSARPLPRQPNPHPAELATATPCMSP